MIALIAMIISGLFLSQQNEPLKNCPFSFKASDGKVIEGTTDKDGRFHIELEPGMYLLKIGADPVGRMITIEKSTPNLRLHQRAMDPTPGPRLYWDVPPTLGLPRLDLPRI